MQMKKTKTVKSEELTNRYGVKKSSIMIINATEIEHSTNGAEKYSKTW